MTGFWKDGEMIAGSYKILKRFPFVEGELYLTELPSDRSGRKTRFVHVFEPEGIVDPGTWRNRDASVFVPVEDVFVDRHRLVQVFHLPEGHWLGWWLMRTAPLPLEETAGWVRQVTDLVRIMKDSGMEAPVDPQNLLMTDHGLRFLYGCPISRAGGDPVQVKRLAELIWLMLTGKFPGAGGTGPLRTLRRDVPAELEMLLVRAMSPDPLRRPGIKDFAAWAAGLALRPV
ncbi:hypothetical protein [Staphylospora marina]|uniref:hypothetical protein n=1 Tax=Staphylospora marina TaxID=2490858 RepID=UPI000F5BDAAE|nr:hypothetical protein [Staphylospora marina]